MTCPTRKFTLIRSRSLNRTSTFRFTIARIIITASAPALAVAAIMAGGGQTGGASAQPVRPAASAQAAISRASGGNSATLLSTQAQAASRRHRLGWKKEIAWKMMGNRFPWRPKYQFRYLNRLWERESSWRIRAYNPYSGAYGIPQAVPGSKMSSAGPRWRTSARTQIRWGMRYIRSRYGSPRRALAHSNATGWY
ncbi:MAG: lytic transglycosylase domain-containing protein [Streptosporangiaceae bacterium]